MNRPAPRAAVAVAAVLFGTSGSAARFGAPDLDPTVVAAWRVLIGGAVLVVVSCLIGCGPWRYRVRVHQLLLGSGTVAGFQVAFFAAVERLGVAQATVLAIVTAPIAAALTDHARGRAALTARWSLGVLIAGVGVALMSNGSWTFDPVGVSLAVTAGSCFLVYASVLRTLRTDRPDIAAVATVFGGAAPLGLVGLLFARSRAPHTMSATITVLYLGAITTAIAYLLWTYALRHLNVRDTVLITMVEPVTATVLATVVLDEPMSVITIAGIAAVSAGIFIASSTDARPTSPRDETAPISLQDADDPAVLLSNASTSLNAQAASSPRGRARIEASTTGAR